MRWRAWLAAFVLVVAAVGVASAEQGSVRGVVTSVATVQGDDGKVLYTVTLKGEGPWQAVLTVGPESKAAYELVAGLKPGERVAAGWVTEGGKTWVREMVREAARAEGGRTRPEGDRREGDRVKPEGEGTRPRGEGERTEVKPKAERGEGDVRKEGGDREAAEREARAKAERERAYKEERARAERARAEGERREGDRREGDRPDRPALMRTTARVVSVEKGEENTRVIKLAAVESGEEISFTVRANQTELYNQLGNLKAGSTVRVAWKTEAGKPVLTGISRAGDER